MRVKDYYLALKLHRYQATATTFPGLGQRIPNASAVCWGIFAFYMFKDPIVELGNARVLDVAMLETGVRTSKLIAICRISLSHQPLLFPLDKQGNLMPNALWQLVQWDWTENASDRPGSSSLRCLIKFRQRKRVRGGEPDRKTLSKFWTTRLPILMTDLWAEWRVEYLCVVVCLNKSHSEMLRNYMCPSEYGVGNGEVGG
jgi:hypothetical protein